MLQSNYKQLAKCDSEIKGILTENILPNSNELILRSHHEKWPEIIDGDQYRSNVERNDLE